MEWFSALELYPNTTVSLQMVDLISITKTYPNKLGPQLNPTRVYIVQNVTVRLKGIVKK